MTRDDHVFSQPFGCCVFRAVVEESGMKDKVLCVLVPPPRPVQVGPPFFSFSCRLVKHGTLLCAYSFCVF